MASVIDQAIVIRRWDFSETSQTVALFTRAHGMLRGLAKGAKRADVRFSGGFDPLTRGQVGAIVRTGDAMATITAWDLQEIFPATRSTLAGFFAGMALADIVQHAVRDQDPHPVLYDGVLEGLRLLGSDETCEVAVLRALWVALEETGYRPELSRDIRAGDPLPTGDAQAGAAAYAFYPELGGFSRLKPASPEAWLVRTETVALLRALGSGGGAEPVSGVGRATIVRAIRLLSAYFGRVTGGEASGLESFLARIGPGVPGRGEV